MLLRSTLAQIIQKEIFWSMTKEHQENQIVLNNENTKMNKPGHSRSETDEVFGLLVNAVKDYAIFSLIPKVIYKPGIVVQLCSL